jgi:site-specific DNA-methyltransferase (adenine-specific)
LAAAEQTRHLIVHGDCRSLRRLADESVHLIVTSPPYWQLKDYGSGEQIGFDSDYETYVDHLNLAWRECFRVLHPGCRLCVNVGDQFARAAHYGRYKVIPIHAEIIRFCETAGFDFMGQIIWRKTTTSNPSGGGSVMGSFPHPRNGVVRLDFEYILLFKKLGEGPSPGPAQKKAAELTAGEWNAYFSGHWQFPGARQTGHLARFPEELPRRLIRMFSFPGETVLDPFAGSGTTARAARALGRNSVSYEINPEYVRMISEGLGPPGLWGGGAEVVGDDSRLDGEEIEARLGELPYRFADVRKLAQRITPKSPRFGSRIAAGDGGDERELHSVRAVVSPEVVELAGGDQVRLLGIRENPSRLAEAKAFLRDKFRGRRVFLKYDEVTRDPENRRLAYVYLDNKTFVNARLLKGGFAFVDETIPFRLRDKFRSLCRAEGLVQAGSRSESASRRSPFPRRLGKRRLPLEKRACPTG